MTIENAMDALGQEIWKDVLSNEFINGFECQLAFESQLLQKRDVKFILQLPEPLKLIFTPM